METVTIGFQQLAGLSKHCARQLAIIGEKRLELLRMDVQEERVRLLRAFHLALGVSAFGLLAGVTFSGAVVVLLWDCSPVAVLLVLTALYGAAAVAVSRRLTVFLHGWHTLPATRDQLRRDRVCLEKILA